MHAFMKLAVMLWVVLMVAPIRCSAQALDVLYFDYPPYYLTLPDGEAGGFLVERARAVFKQAGVTPRFLFVPPKRILAEIQSGRPVASLGWFKTPEREVYARFSHPFYINRPYEIMFLRERDERFRGCSSFAQMMESGRFTLGRVEGFSDGQYVDAVVSKFAERVVLVAVDSVRLLRMLDAGRFDFMLVPPEEVDALLLAAGMTRERFEFKTLEDIPQGNVRHIMYSKSVAEGLIRRIDDAIASGIPTPGQ